MINVTIKRGHSLKLNDEITIRVVDIDDDEIRLGIHASKNTPVCNAEIYKLLNNPGTNKEQDETVHLDLI